jgi:hypothetical protein
LDHPVLTLKVSADHHQRAGVRPITQETTNRPKANEISLPLPARSIWRSDARTFCRNPTTKRDVGVIVAPMIPLGRFIKILLAHSDPAYAPLEDCRSLYPQTHVTC